jgi:Ca-activated chloride channel family protein
MKLSTNFDYPRLAANQEQTVHLMISAQAPKIDWAGNRKPVTIVATIDISSSMHGPKMEYAKKSTMKLIDNLGAEDKLGIIAFDHNVETITEPVLMTPETKQRLKEQVSRLQPRGSTNFSGAMLEALKHASQNGPARVILFTDGQPTAGVTNTHQIVELLKSNLKNGTTVSCFGYGDDHDSKFLTQLADLGQGNYAYIKNPDDALVAFAKELGGLMSCYAQNLKFKIEAKEGVELVQVLSDVDVEETEKGLSITVSDLYAEEVRHILVEMKLPAHKALPRAVTVADVFLSYVNTQTTKSETASDKAQVEFKKEGPFSPEVEVQNQLALARINTATKQAATFAAQGDILRAKGVFANINLDGASAAVQGYANTAQSFYADNQSYLSNVNNISATLSASRRGRGTSTLTSAVYGSNSAMNSMEKAFTQDEDNTLKVDSAGAQGISSGAASSIGVSIGSSSTGGAGGSSTTAASLADALKNGTLTLNGGTGTVLNTTASTSSEKKKLSKKKNRAEW